MHCHSRTSLQEWFSVWRKSIWGTANARFNESRTTLNPWASIRFPRVQAYLLSGRRLFTFQKLSWLALRGIQHFLGDYMGDLRALLWKSDFPTAEGVSIPSGDDVIGASTQSMTWSHTKRHLILIEQKK